MPEQGALMSINRGATLSRTPTTSIQGIVWKLHPAMILSLSNTPNHSPNRITADVFSVTGHVYMTSLYVFISSTRINETKTCVEEIKTRDEEIEIRVEEIETHVIGT